MSLPSGERFKLLPTHNIILDENMVPITGKSYKTLEREGRPYIDCVVHYRTESDGSIGNLLNVRQIPVMYFMMPNTSGSSSVVRILNYGVEPEEPVLANRWPFKSEKY